VRAVYVWLCVRVCVHACVHVCACVYVPACVYTLTLQAECVDVKEYKGEQPKTEGHWLRNAS